MLDTVKHRLDMIKEIALESERFNREYLLLKELENNLHKLIKVGND